MPDDSLRQALRTLEDDLDLGSGFLVSLWADQNAWSFVIRSHALLETALSQLLLGHLLDQRLEKAVQVVPVGGKGGKIAFLKAMGLVTPEEETFINEFSHLRNSLVHNVHSTRFDFQTFLTTDPTQAKRLASSAAGFAETADVRRRYEEEFAKRPTHLLWLATIFIVAKSRKQLLNTQQARRDLQERLKRLYDS